MKAEKSNHYVYNRCLKPYANKLRKRMTKAEACMWKYVLRASKIKAYKFRRQRPVLNYIADFMCKDLMLVIEVDGFTHLLEEVRARDQKRTAELEKAGFTVLRFTNEEVLRNIGDVMERLGKWIEEREEKHYINPNISQNARCQYSIVR